MKAKTLVLPLFLLLLAGLGSEAKASGRNGRLKQLHAKFRHLFITKPEAKDIVRDTLYLMGPKTEYRVGKGIAIKCEGKSGKCAAVYTKAHENGGTADRPVVETWSEDGGSTVYYPQSMQMAPAQNGGMEIQMTF